MAVQKKRTKEAAQSKPEDYNTTKAFWYNKLVRAGFDDIEVNEYRLKQYSSRFNQEVVVRSWNAKSEYYSMAGRFLHNYSFKSNLEKIIWEYHLNGISARDISKLLKKVKVMKPNKDNVSTIIKRLAVEMKKMYLPGYKDPNE